MVKRVVEDAVSPAVLAEELGVSVTVIREWVKKRGHKLPSKYKVTNNAPKKTIPPVSTATGPTNQG